MDALERTEELLHLTNSITFINKSWMLLQLFVLKVTTYLITVKLVQKKLKT